MQACQPVETPVTGCDAFLPKAVPLVRSECVSLGEAGDIVGGQNLVDGSLVDVLHRQEEHFQHVVRLTAVGLESGIGGAGDAALAHAIDVETIGDCLDAHGVQHGLGGEKIVFGTTQAVGKAQVVVHQELAPVSPLPNTYEVDVRGLQAVAIVVAPAVGGFGFTDGWVVGLFAGGVVQFLGIEGYDVLAGEFCGEGGQGAVGEEVVAVHKEDILAPSFVEAAVAGGAHASVLLVDDLHVVVTIQQGRRAVGAAVVDNDDLAALVFLREDAVEALRQVGFDVVGGYDDGEFHKLDAMISAMVFRVLSEEVVEALLQFGEVGCHHLPGVVLQAGLFEEVFVLLWIALQICYLVQEGAVVAVGVPEEDGVVVEDVGFGVAAGAPVDGYAAGADAVEEFFGDVALDRGVLRADVEAVLLQEFGFVVVELRLQLVGVVQ